MTATQPAFAIRRRTLIEVNTDPQRRCYNGAHFSSELRFTNWGVLESGLDEATATRRMEFWRGLNDYAVRERGKVGTLCEFEVIEQGEQA